MGRSRLSVCFALALLGLICSGNAWALVFGPHQCGSCICNTLFPHQSWLLPGGGFSVLCAAQPCTCVVRWCPSANALSFSTGFCPHIPSPGGCSGQKCQ